MPRSALFVIDVQHESAGDPATRIPHHERIRAAGAEVLSAARHIIDAYRDRDRESPSIVVFVQHEEPAGEGTLVRDSEAWRLVFEPREGVKEEVLVAKTTRTWDSASRSSLVAQEIGMLTLRQRIRLSRIRIWR